MSLQIFSCKPESSGAAGGNPAVHGSAVSHDLGAGCRARRQGMLAVGWLAFSMVCVGSHSCPLGSPKEGSSHAPWEGSFPHLFQTTPAMIISLAWTRVGLQAWEKLICPP